MILLLIPEGGYVEYKTVVRTVGFLPDEIRGISREIGGKFEYMDGKVEGSLEIPVLSFRSGNSSRDRDVAKILKYKEYPKIRVRVSEVKKGDAEGALKGEVNKAKVRVEIFAAGRAKDYQTLAQFSKVGEDRIKVRLKVNAKFTDCGIEPPSLGVFIKRAPDELELSGEITFRIEKKEG
jgi:polyisoprenoid-binding protein YceI